jgi:arginine decarboxylase
MPSEQLRAPYLEALQAYGHRGPARMHVPGHGGGIGADPALVAALGSAAFELDLPQDIKGVDLGPAPTPYQQAESLAAEAYGAGRTWFLTNGATQGNHAICLALAPAGATAIVQRNCHGSVVDGLVLSGGSAAFLSPAYDEALGMATAIAPEGLERALGERPEASVAMLVSPTYFGMVADVEGCAAVAHAAGVPLVVDCSWGAHFGFHPELPGSPLAAGADVVLTSNHKHAGSFTQSAMLHVGPGREELSERLARSVRLLRSTSPSSLLLASLDASRRQLAVNGPRLLAASIAAAVRLRDQIERTCGACRILDRSWAGQSVAAWDPLRVVVDVRDTSIPAMELLERMRDVHDVHVEFATHTCIVLVVPVGLTDAAADRVARALAEAVASVPRERRSGPARLPSRVGGDEGLGAPCSPRSAFFGQVERVPREQAVGCVSAEAISAYPPGIPALLPGERVSAEALEHLVSLRAAGLRLHGASDPDLRTLTVSARGSEEQSGARYLSAVSR